jgi:hypothetical protein
MASSQIIAGYIWYRSSGHYERCLAAYDDADDLPRAFEDWRRKAEDTVERLESQGARVVRVEIDPDTLPAWCQAHGFNSINAEARTHFANLMAARSVGINA